MKTFVIGFVIAAIASLVLFFLFLFVLYQGIFCLPRKKRPHSHEIPDSVLYQPYKDTMLDTVLDVENTPYEEVSILSEEGERLCGRYYEGKKNAPIMIFFHGYHGVPEWDGYGIFKICKTHGINLLLADMRAHGKSGSNVITFGIRERFDVKRWVEYVIKKNETDSSADKMMEEPKIILAGVSMGASSVLMATELGLPANVKAVISDCAYSSPEEIVKETIRKMKLPVGPVFALVNLSAHLFGHFDLREDSPLEAVKNLHIPVLFIQGKQDCVVPLSMGEQLYKNCTAKKERIVIEDADHANSAMTDYGKYQEAVMGFLGKITE